MGKGQGRPPHPPPPPAPPHATGVFRPPSIEICIVRGHHSRRKGKGRRCFFLGGGVEYIKFLAELALCPQDDFK